MFALIFCLSGFRFSDSSVIQVLTYPVVSAGKSILILVFHVVIFSLHITKKQHYATSVSPEASHHFNMVKYIGRVTKLKHLLLKHIMLIYFTSFYIIQLILHENYLFLNV